MTTLESSDSNIPELNVLVTTPTEALRATDSMDKPSFLGSFCCVEFVSAHVPE